MEKGMATLQIGNRVEWHGVPYIVRGVNETGAGVFYWLQHRSRGHHVTTEPEDAPYLVFTSAA